MFLRGTVEHDVVLPAAPAGFVADTLIVRGATLTFPESADVKMRALAKIEVSPSGASPGALVANKVTFRSAAENAKAGDWSGIELNASPSKLADCKISHAGGPLTMVRSAVRIFADDSKTSIVRTTFADNAGDAIESATSCGPFEDPVNGNTSTTKMCQVALPPPPSGPVLKIIGSLGAASGTPWAGDVGDTFGHGGLGLVGVGGSGGVGTTSATSSSGAKVTEVSASVTGRLPPEVVRRIVRLNTPRLRHCYDTARKSDPTLAGTVQVKFAIGPSGDVTSASVGGGTLTNPSAVSCIATVFKGLSFPQPESGSVLVSMTHDYKP